MSSNEYLTRINLMDAANEHADTPINIGKNVLVVGGGNTAMDSCRTAKRLGSNVTLVYRRSEAEMPARLEEVKHAKEEGITFLPLHNPIEYIADESGAVKQVCCKRCNWANLTHQDVDAQSPFLTASRNSTSTLLWWPLVYRLTHWYLAQYQD